MKKLRIPEDNNDEYVDIYEITTEFKGLIIGYKNNNPIGYFQYSIELGQWYFMTTINATDCCPGASEFDNILEAIKHGLKDNIFDELKVIEFD